MKTNRIIKIKAALFIAMSVLISACTIEDADQSVEPKAEKLSIDESVQMTATETEKSFSVKSDVGWTISIESGWDGLSVSPTSGNGDAQVTIHSNVNTTRQGREATISINTTGGVNQKLVVNQALSDVILNIDGLNTLEFEASPEEPKTFSFSCNTTWQITTSESWIKCDKTEGGETISTTVGSTISVTVDEIQSDVPRDGIVLISAENGAKTQQIIVSQEGKKIELSVSPERFDVLATGEEKTIQITCNADWTLETKGGLLLCDATKGTGDLNVVVTCLPNNISTERKDTIVITSGIQDIKTEMVIFTQAAATPPVLTSFTLDESSVTKNEAEFVLNFDTMYPIADYGIYIWEDGKGESTKEPKQSQNTESGITQLKYKVTGLKSMTTYHAYGFVKNSVGGSDSQNSNVITFTTAGVRPGDDDNPVPNLSRKK